MPDGVFDHELAQACAWLLRVKTKTKGGIPAWGWLQDYPPNAQNTAEVMIGLTQAGRADASLQRGCVDYLVKSLDEPGCNLRDRGWITVALNEMAKDGIVGLDDARREAAAAVLADQNDDGGWAVTRGETSIVPTTALAVEALRERTDDESRCAVKRGVEWMKSSCGPDGGWSLISPRGGDTAEDDETLDPKARQIVADARNRSNAACTAFAMLTFIRTRSHRPYVERAAQWLLEMRTPHVPGVPSTGGWDIFRERGIRRDEWYTFRHFSTAWSLIALCEARGEEFARSRDCLEATNYLLKLQDPVIRPGSVDGGGWRTSFDGEPYTWATVNAMSALTAVGEHLATTTGEKHLAALRAELTAVEARVTFVPSEGRQRLAFNGPSLMVAAIVVTLLSIAWVDAELRPADGNVARLILVTIALTLVFFVWSAVVAAWRSPEAPRFAAHAGGALAIVGVIAGVLAAVLFA
jgi:hypothetical protein